MHKKIVVLESNYLLNAGVQSILATNDCFDVTGIESSDPEQIFLEIERIQPDIIIIDQDTQFNSMSALLSRLVDFPHIRVVALNISENQIQVFEKRQVRIHQLSDFIGVLK